MTKAEALRMLQGFGKERYSSVFVGWKFRGYSNSGAADDDRAAAPTRTLVNHSYHMKTAVVFTASG
jgi:hypothetical protein